MGRLMCCCRVSQPTWLWSLCSLGVNKIETPEERILHGSDASLWNGMEWFPRNEADFHVWSDASGSSGCGAALDCTAMFQHA